MCPAVYFRAADLLLHHPGYADEPVFLHLLFGWSSGDLSNGRLDPPLPADCAAGLALTKKEFVMKPWQHFKTITRHRLLVMVNCFRIGLIRQGLTHDLSKYSPTEFWTGAKYYQGIRSPNAAEREKKGYSAAWLHHKGRNRHHYEYWTDLNPATRRYEPVPMPRRYLAEMVMDRIAASKVYRGKQYTDGSPLEYFLMSQEGPLMHQQTERQLTMLLTMLRDQGETATFRFIREMVLPGKDF